MTERTIRRYQAIGTVEGVLVLAGASSTLTVGESSFHAIVAKKAIPHINSGEPQFFRVYANFTKDQKLAFRVIGVTPTPVTPPPATPLILQGCCELDDGVPRMMIYRNERHIYSDHKSRKGAALLERQD